MLKLLRIEAINFGQSIGDTNQLSVVRGGGLLMREIIIDLAESINRCYPQDPEVSFETVSTGGSIGIFLYSDKAFSDYSESADSDQIFIRSLESALTGREIPEAAPPWLKKAMNEFRNSVTGKLAYLLSFGITVRPLPEHTGLDALSFELFKKANTAAISEIRRKQLRQPNVVMLESEGDEVCVWDGLRAVGYKDNFGIKSEAFSIRDEKVSESVYRRFQVGRNAKQEGPLFRFYSREIRKAGVDSELVKSAEETLRVLSKQKEPFPEDLESLCGAVDSLRHPSKIAVIYADGNKFGRMLGEGNLTLAKYTEWDQMLQRSRARFLASMLLWLDGKRAKDRPIPLEIFLWGGDEIMFAVPANLALEAVSRVFQFSSDLSWDQKNLTHALGLVICNYKTPIQRIQLLAKNLAERVKNRLGDDLEQQQDAWLYAVLESVDTPTNLEDFFQKRYGNAHELITPMLKSEYAFTEVLETATRFLDRAPRSQLYAMAHELSNQPSSGRALERFEEVTGIDQSDMKSWVLKALPHMVSSDDEAIVSSILHWVELADYWPKSAPGSENMEVQQ